MEDGDLNKQVPNYYNDAPCPIEGKVSTPYFAQRSRSAILF